ncbi:hypothetical protein PFISCL1PPCAC_26995 [Pristionchus fissidentatus]|uniref:Uncharacterized protein n=1 Tax=Pristionchus fissidentatus TaxID=1538716 RepID=A0AAV5WZR5_9BILA|nr:hypothetical protein PFISCL1PPCAC_26995 [Pristionchus fissidentatus]
MDSPFERPQNPSPPPSSPSSPMEEHAFVFPSASHSLTRQPSFSLSSDGYETDSQLGDDVPLSLTTASSMESLPTDDASPFLLAAVNSRFFGGNTGKHAVMLNPTLSRYLITNRNWIAAMEDEDEIDGSEKRMRIEYEVESDDEEPTDESTFIGNSRDEDKHNQKSDDDDLYEF